MGQACAKCSDMQAQQGTTKAPPPGASKDLMNEASGTESSSGSESEEASESSEDEEGAASRSRKTLIEDKLQGSAELKRGHTAAFNEAISTAKAMGLSEKKIAEAEQRLVEHHAQQRRLAAEQVLDEFMRTAAEAGVDACKEMVQLCMEADVSSEKMRPLRDLITEMLLTRPLELEEVIAAKKYLVRTCRAFVGAMLDKQAGGRAVVYVDPDDGTKYDGTISVDPPLKQITLSYKDGKGKPTLAASVLVPSLVVEQAPDSAALAEQEGFLALKEKDREICVSVSFEDVDGESGAWCLMEKNDEARIKLMEALNILQLASSSDDYATPRASILALVRGRGSLGFGSASSVESFKGVGSKLSLGPAGSVTTGSRSTSRFGASRSSKGKGSRSVKDGSQSGRLSTTNSEKSPRKSARSPKDGDDALSPRGSEKSPRKSSKSPRSSKKAKGGGGDGEEEKPLSPKESTRKSSKKSPRSPDKSPR